MAEEFDLLAAKVLSGEATESERARFEQFLSTHPDWRAEFDELRKLWPKLKEAAPAARAWEAAPEQPPAEKLQQWMDRVDNRLGSQSQRRRRQPALIALALAAVLIAAAVLGVLLLPDSKSQASPLQIALSKPAGELHGLLISVRDSKVIPIYSPVGFTTEVTPGLLWKAAPGKTYDINVVDELEKASQPFRLRGVTPPIDFTNAWPGRTLSRDGLYRFHVSEAGKPLIASEITFRILPQANSGLSSDPLDRAYEMLAANPPRMGDALAILLTLPAEFANSERALRLKIFAFGQLGYTDDFETALHQLRSKP